MKQTSVSEKESPKNLILIGIDGISPKQIRKIRGIIGSIHFKDTQVIVMNTTVTHCELNTMEMNE